MYQLTDNWQRCWSRQIKLKMYGKADKPTVRTLSNKQSQSTTSIRVDIHYEFGV
jgi:hypothetical protein